MDKDVEAIVEAVSQGTRDNRDSLFEIADKLDAIIQLLESIERRR